MKFAVKNRSEICLGIIPKKILPKSDFLERNVSYGWQLLLRLLYRFNNTQPSKHESEF